MRLRTRLAAATAAVALPQVVALMAWDLHARRLAAEEALTDLLPSYLGADAEAACLADPAGFGGDLPPPGPPPGGPPSDAPHGRAPTLLVYRGDGEALRPDLPPLGSALALGRIQPVATPWYGAEVAVGVRTGWAEPCAQVVLGGSTAPGWLGAVLPASPVWLLPLLTTLAGVWLAAGAPLRRISRLTERVSGVAAGGYRAGLGDEGDDEIAALARAFDDAGQALRAREDALRTYMANTSHDVMLPLTVLRGHLDALRDGGADPRVLAAAMDEAHYLGALLHNLAAAARLEGSLPIEPHALDLCALLTRVALRHQTIAAAKGVEVVYALPGEPLHVRGDLTLLEQAANNLAYNAVRHNRAGGHVGLLLERTNDTFVLRVFDDGPGVPEAELARLAERGYRTDEARSRAPEGQGIGLSIVAAIAGAHGFTFSLRRSEHGGLEARIEGPVLPESA